MLAAECSRSASDGIGVGILLQAEIDERVLPGDRDVVGLVLGERLRELAAAVVRPRVALHGEVAAVDRGQVVNAARRPCFSLMGLVRWCENEKP
jgi:hypothetical protein